MSQPGYCPSKFDTYFPLILRSQFSFKSTYSLYRHFSENFCSPRFGDYFVCHRGMSKDLENAIGSRLAVLDESPMSVRDVCKIQFSNSEVILG